MRGNHPRPRIAENRVRRIGKRRFHNHTRQLRMRSGLFEGQVRAQSRAVEHNGSRSDVPGSGQILHRPFGILAPVGLAGPHKLALPVAPVVEGQHVYARGVQPGECVHTISQIAVLSVQVEDREPGEFCVGGGSDPPARKPWRARVGGGESHRIEGQARGRRRAHNHRRRMVKQLPAALPEEQAERAPCAKNSRADGEGDGAQQPTAWNLGRP